MKSTSPFFRRPMGVLAGVTTFAVLSILVGAPAAQAAQAPYPTPSQAAALRSAPLVVDGMNLDAGGTVIVNDLERTVVAPGLTHLRFERIQPDGWQQINILKAELSPSTVKVGYIGPKTIAGVGATVTEMTDDAGAIAGVNGDFFDINNSWAPLGWAVSNGNILKSANPGSNEVLKFDGAGLGSIAQLYLQGQITWGVGDQAKSVPLTTVNSSAMPAGGVTLFNSAWGSSSRTRVLVNGTAGVEVTVDAGGAVSAVSNTVGAGVIPAGVQVLVAADGTAAATTLRTLAVGDKVSIGYQLADNLDTKVAIGSNQVLLRDGTVVNSTNPELHPRTMVGLSADGATAYFVVLDGRTALARGMTLREQGTFMKELGADDAINLDGGGSSQLNVRETGNDLTTVKNTPSDGFERFDGNGLGLFLAQPGSKQLTGFELKAQLTSPESVRVFPGLHRTLLAKGHDESNTSIPTPASTTWSSSDTATATVTGARVAGVTPGTSRITAASGVANGSVDVSVLGALTGLTTEQTVLNLETKGSSAIVTVTGHDVQGFHAPVEAADLTVKNPQPEVFSVQPTADGRFKITATGDEGAANVTFSANGVTTSIAVAVPLEVRVIDDFSNVKVDGSLESWTAAMDRAPLGGSVVLGEGHQGSNSIRVNYDFTQSTGTRGQYAVAPGAPRQNGAIPAGGTGGIDIPGRPQKLSVWVKGDGKGALLRLQVMQANGVRNWIDGPGGSQSLHATWTGWERQDFIVPESFTFPLKLERIRILETVAARQYTGALEFSKIYAYLPPDGIEAPVAPTVEDPIVVDAGATDDNQLRVAVMSDAQFVARDPNSFQVIGARKALREIVAAKPDLLLINGDFVDEASPADFLLARKILDEELAGVTFPWRYIPGNHEIMGGAIANFINQFGANYGTLPDLKKTRIITVDSSTGVLNKDFTQVKMLRDQLDSAAADPAITGVLVVSHMPTDDPTPTNGSQLTDRNEAAMIDGWLQDFRANSGKSIAYIGSHVGVFHTSSVDGVPYVINGNSGKDPATAPEDGGFTGWTMLGLNPDQGVWAGASSQWLEAEVKPRVDPDGLTVTVPAQLKTGEKASYKAYLTQDQIYGGRDVPVEWPVSFSWTGTRVHYGTVASASTADVLAVDTRSHRVTALKAGRATVSLTVNGQTLNREITVLAAPVLAITKAPKTVSTKGTAVLEVTATGSDAFAGTFQLFDGDKLVAESPLTAAGSASGATFAAHASFREAGSGLATGRRQYRVAFVGATGTAGTTSAPVEVQVHHSDNPPGSLFYKEIMWLADSGITTGNADGSFAPASALSRQAMAAFLYRLKHDGAAAPQCTVAPYTDVPVGADFCGEISWLKSTKISTGFAGDTFRLAAQVERQAVAAFLFRLQNPETPKPTCTTAPFVDVPVDSVFCGEISWLKSSNILGGYPNGELKPDRATDRQAVAAFLYRLSHNN